MQQDVQKKAKYDTLMHAKMPQNTFTRKKRRNMTSDACKNASEYFYTKKKAKWAKI